MRTSVNPTQVQGYTEEIHNQDEENRVHMARASKASQAALRATYLARAGGSDHNVQAGGRPEFEVLVRKKVLYVDCADAAGGGSPRTAGEITEVWIARADRDGPDSCFTPTITLEF